MKSEPTPKRKDAEAARKKALKVPRDSKEAKKAVRQRAREQRLEARLAMNRGEEWAMPFRDKGPVRRHVRNLVDSRWHFGELFLPLALVVLVLSLIPNPTVARVVYFLWLAMMLGTIVDEVLLAFKIKKEINQNYSDPKERKGAIFYGLMRALQLRSLRIPPAVVKIGGAPKEIK
ncbi:MAG: hypothetical protein RIS18_748 [Actinomycetota bacterium]|jgi:hypothetical protein